MYKGISGVSFLVRERHASSATTIIWKQGSSSVGMWTFIFISPSQNLEATFN